MQSQTFAVSGITSVKLGVDQPSKLIPILLIAIGGLGCVAGIKEGLINIWTLLFVFGIAWMFTLKSKYTVILATASGESKAVVSENKEFIEQIVAGLNKAIIER
ncbi:MAG: QacE [Gammaproteobacteria bacterium]|nr:QacE [Gammaproteobacteria bacterium]